MTNQALLKQKTQRNAYLFNFWMLSFEHFEFWNLNFWVIGGTDPLLKKNTTRVQLYPNLNLNLNRLSVRNLQWSSSHQFKYSLVIT
jgi:hypothetical protein